MVVRREKDDWGARGLLSGSNEFCRFKAIEPFHLNVEQDGGKFLIVRLANRFLSRVGPYKIAEPIEDSLQSQQISWMIIHEKDVDLRIVDHANSNSTMQPHT